MGVYVDAYERLSKRCVEFCEDNKYYFADIIAEIYTDVLGHDFVYCMCSGDCNKFEFITDWYEGGNLKIINMDYFHNVCKRAFKKPDTE